MPGSSRPDVPDGPVPAGSAPESAGPERYKLSADPIELYKAVRAHEVMLNEATSSFEHAVITRLAALNAGAAGVFLTLLGVLLKANGRQPLDTPFAAAAIVAWSAGLLAASAAAWYGLRQQRTTNTGYRVMREGIEHYLWPDIAPFAQAPDDDAGRAADADHQAATDRAEELRSRLVRRRALRTEALSYGRMFNRMIPISAGCFAAGAACALAAVVT